LSHRFKYSRGLPKTDAATTAPSLIGVIEAKARRRSYTVSTSAILPISSIDFGGASATASEQSVFSNLLNQLQQAVGTGNLTTSATLLNAIESLSPSSKSGNTPLGAFLTSLGEALNDGSATEAQSALATYQSTTPADTAPAASSASTSASAAQISAGLIQSQIQLSLVTALLGPGSSFGSTASAGTSNPANSSSNSVNSLLGLLQAAYPSGSGSGSASSTPATSSVTPYDTLVSSIQASLAGGHGTITPALAYLQASGNFVNTTA
jgi:hypothetical protein